MKQGKGVGRYTRLGIGVNISLMVVGGLAVLIFLNMIASLPGMWIRKDITEQEIHQLADQTLEILKDLPGEVEVSTFLRPDPGTSMAGIVLQLDELLQILLRQYQYHSGGQVRHERFRVDQDYGRAKNRLEELSIKEDENIVVVRYGSRKVQLSLIPEIALVTPERRNALNQRIPPRLDQFLGEGTLNRAILSVTTPERPRVGFLTQHGEPSIQDSENPGGMFRFAEALRKLDYEVVEVDLKNNPEVLSTLKVLAIIGPSSPMIEPEWKALRQYLDEGGRVLLTVNYVLDAAQESDFASLLYDWGLQGRLGLVSEPLAGQHYGIPEVRLVSVLDGLTDLHPITRTIRKRGVRVTFPGARALERTAKHPEGITLITLATTGMLAWDDLPGGRALFPDQGTEQVGPRTLAYAVTKEHEDKEKRMRAVVLGTRMMAHNQYFPQGREFLINSISWLAKRNSLVSLPPRPPDQRWMPWTEGRRSLFFWICVIGVPGASLLGGFLVWFFRRR